jgi:Flp pilus assembly pilin Flp
MNESSRLGRWWPGQVDAQGLVEYALIIALVALIAIAGLIVMWPTLAALFSGMAASV